MDRLSGNYSNRLVMRIVMSVYGLFFLSLMQSAYAQEAIIVADFSKNSLSSWNEKEFSKKTLYTLKKLPEHSILNASSQQSASGLFKEIHIDLKKTPYVNWSWKIDNQLKGINERSKEGDDYAARIYLVKKHALLFWKTKALNYVWSSNQNKGVSWDNAYTSQAKMLAVEGQTSTVGQWYTEKRNVRDDFKRLFGETVDSIDVVAIMSDTDNSKKSVSASYGKLFFTAQ